MNQLRQYGLAGATIAIASLLSACGGSSSDSTDTPGIPSPIPTSAPGTPLTASYEVTGWASQGNGTTGGATAPASNIYIVRNRAELKAALANSNSPTYASNPTVAKLEPKTIYVMGSIYGTDLGNGQLTNEAYYKTLTTTYKNINNWDFENYIGYVSAQASGGTATTEQTAAASVRQTMQNAQKAQIEFSVPSNTTLMGVGANAKLIDGYLSINAQSNIVIRNIEFEAPIDLAPSYDWEAGKEEWNARFKAISMVTGKQVWIDHCTFSDGANPDTEKRTINGVTKTVQRHDGLLDIEDSSDYVTVSYSVFKNHDKTNMVGGSGDGNGAKERAYNRLTFSNNIWQDSVQRAPRARFGQIHVYNNYYSGNTDATTYAASYYIGMGAESRILSEANVFDMSGSKAAVSKVISNLNGYQFKDVGSWFNGAPASAELEAAAKTALEARWSSARKAADGSATPTADKVNSVFTLAAYTNELGWTPPYNYTRGSSADTVRQHNLAHAGAGKLFVNEGSSNRPLLSDSQGETYTVAKALAGTDSWAPQTARLNPASFTASYVVAKDGSGSHATIQAALNAAATSTAARVYIQVKAGDYNEQLIVGNTTAAVTLYSTESDASKVRIYNALSKGSAQSAYTALVGAPYASSVYVGNSDAQTVYNACMASGKVSAIGTECSATMRVRNNGFQLVNITVENAWVETGTNDQANAVMIDKADKVVLDGVRLLGNQDTLYLANAGKRVFVTSSEIAGDVDFIYGAGIGVFEGSTIRTIGTRKASGTSITSPSTTAASQIHGLLFNNSIFIADAATTANSIYLARQWDDGGSSDIAGKAVIRNSFLGKHIATGAGPWSPTMISGAATAFTNGNQPLLAEYRNWQETSWLPAGVTPTPSPSPSPSPTPTEIPTPAPTQPPITGNAAFTVPHSLSTVPASGVGVTYDSSLGQYTLVSAGKYSTPGDSVQMVYSQVTGNFTATADLVSMTIPATYTAADVTAGLIIRNSLSPTSQYYYIVLRGSLEVRGGHRMLATTGGGGSTAWAPKLTALPTAATPLKLKLQRSGQIITVTYSTDNGASWATAKTGDFSVGGTTSTPFGDTVYVGLVGGSGLDASTALTSTSIFKNVSVTAN